MVKFVNLTPHPITFNSLWDSSYRAFCRPCSLGWPSFNSLWDSSLSKEEKRELREIFFQFLMGFFRFSCPCVSVSFGTAFNSLWDSSRGAGRRRYTRYTRTFNSLWDSSGDRHVGASSGRGFQFLMGFFGACTGMRTGSPRRFWLSIPYGILHVSV